MKGSRTTKRWVLGIAVSSALLGLVLKLSDLRGLDDPRGGAAESANRGAGVVSPAGAVDRREGPVPSLAEVPTSGNDGGWTARVADDRAAAVLQPSTRQDTTGRHVRPRDRPRRR